MSIKNASLWETETRHFVYKVFKTHKSSGADISLITPSVQTLSEKTESEKFVTRFERMSVLETFFLYRIQGNTVKLLKMHPIYKEKEAI